MSELIYKVLASALAVAVLGGVGVAFWQGVREGLRENRAAGRLKRLARARSAAGQACVAQVIEPEQTGPVSFASGKPLAFPFVGPEPAPCATPRSLPPLTVVEYDLLRSLGQGRVVREAGDAIRLRRLQAQYPKLLWIGAVEPGDRGFFFCRPALWAWVALQRRDQIELYIDADPVTSQAAA